ncbi:NUDIX domain-containing protein [Mitsuaria sp. GD03876]|uniref:NUDIX hydrolase n=1 Tax=Mitsuaria sp. GD03876 TaxID=2975399 RepID=UPI00244C658D|nr:NUDIX domain-containing protein [Mitsuaria sp. GD03876]MDH0867115.1 NUDIX domain-containing protein [Mitsuaria sp. GD03876]
MEFERPIVTVDIVLLTLLDGVLHAGLTQRDKAPALDAWTLPGGWVHTDRDQDADDAAARILREKAGLVSPYLEQLRTFSGMHRDSRGWSLSVSYYAVVPGSLQAAGERFRWAAVDGLRSLPFDHAQILRTAVERVRSKTLYSSLPVHLMPAEFSLGELQRTYEQVLGAELDKRGFRRRIEELDVIEEIPGAFTSGGSHRPAQLYRKKAHAPALKVAASNLAVG